MKKFTNEIKTGLVVVMAILAGLFFWIKTVNFKTDSYKLKTSFSHADGIKENSIVALAGIEAGRVDSVQFAYGPEGTSVDLVLIMDKEARVREDSIAFIGATGFIGDSYIGITPGTTPGFLKENANVLSEDPVEMRELMKRADEISKNLDSILGDVKTIVSDNKDKVESVIVNLEQASTNFNEFSEDIKEHPWKLLMKGKDKKKK
ncbi:MAG: MCE family protein [Candidatus Omnitrophica bacterium]|nr:MCE family protein [Candidatus Omnitrophota bacterium]